MTRRAKPARWMEYADISTLQPAASNPKRHHGHLGSSVSRFGFADAVILDERTQKLVAGHGRLEELQRRKAAGEAPPDGVTVKGEQWLVPVQRGWSSRSDAEASAFLVAHNRIGEAGGWDDQALTDLLAEIGADVDIDGLGFSDDELQRILAEVTPPEERQPGDGEKPDAAEERAPLTDPEGVTLMVGHVLDELRKLPADSVHCVVTSPPYWGLRDYGLPPTIWGGDPACGHEWGEEQGRRKQSTPAARGGRFGDGDGAGRVEKHADEITIDASTGAHCLHCSAWRGCLGLEPTPEMFLQHLVEVFAEVRRVLRPDGICWVNLGSSYASGDTQPSRSRPGAPARGNGRKALSGSRAADPSCCGSCGGRLAGSPIRRDRSGSKRQPREQGQPLDATTTRGSEPTVSTAAGASPPAAQESTTASCTPSAPASSSPSSGTRDLSTPETGPGGALESARKGSCTCDKSSTSRPSTRRNSGRASSGSACGNPSCEGCGVCWVYSSIPSLRLKAKDRIMQPALFALAAQADGWWIRSEIVWAKGVSFHACAYAGSVMPASVRDRPTDAHEMLYLLTKSPRYFYDAEAVREEAKYGPQPNDAAIFRRVGDGASAPEHGISLPPRVDNSSAGRNLRTVWTINPQAYREAHFATYPEKLVAPCITAGTSPHGACAECGAPWRRAGSGWEPTCEHADADLVPCTVLDPFNGSGTTGLVARRLGCRYIGIELNPEYAALARKRITDD